MFHVKPPNIFRPKACKSILTRNNILITTQNTLPAVSKQPMFYVFFLITLDLQTILQKYVNPYILLCCNVQLVCNRIGVVMVSVLASSAVDRGFEPRSCQTKDCTVGMCCFSVKHAV
jgi:hypothetical protein